ncbi:unnamed protein product [Rotaria sp. Silwood2]|nr:unnamed protein product [Rotaria sp. Silwood2]
MSRHLMNVARLSNCLKYVNIGYQLFNKGHYRKFHQNNTNKINDPPRINLCLMKDEHRNEVSSLVIESFFRDEPLNRRLSFDLPKEPAEFTNMAVEKAFQDKCSYVAIDKNQQKVIGVSLNLIESKNNETNILDSSQFKSEKLRYIFKLLEDVHGQIDLFNTFNTDRLLHVLMLSVNGEYRGLNLTRQLIDLSIKQAKAYGIKGAFSETTGYYSSRVMLKMGFQIYNEIIYDKYDQKRLSNLGIHDRCLLIARPL